MLEDRIGALPSQSAVLAQPEHQLLVGPEVAECTTDGGHRLAVQDQERPGVLQPIAGLHREHLATLRRRRQGLTCEPPGLRELLAWHDEAVLDPLDTRGLAARSGTRKAASGLGRWGFRDPR